MGLVGAELLVNFIRREGLVRRLVWVQRGRHDLVPQRSTPLSSGESWGEHLLQELLSVCHQTSKPWGLKVCSLLPSHSLYYTVTVYTQQRLTRDSSNTVRSICDCFVSEHVQFPNCFSRDTDQNTSVLHLPRASLSLWVWSQANCSFAFIPVAILVGTLESCLNKPIAIKLQVSTDCLIFSWRLFHHQSDTSGYSSSCTFGIPWHGCKKSNYYIWWLDKTALVQGLKWEKIIWREPWKISGSFNSMWIAFCGVLKNMQKLTSQETALFHLISFFFS